MPAPALKESWTEPGIYRSYGISCSNGKPFESIKPSMRRNTIHQRSALTNGDRYTPMAWYHDFVITTGFWHQDRVTTCYLADGQKFGTLHNRGVEYNPGFTARNYTSFSGVDVGAVPMVRSADRWTEVQNSLLDKINAKSMDLGATFVELGSTANYVASTATELLSMAIAVKNGRWHKAFRRYIKRRDYQLLPTAGSRFLEVKFAILPLVADISSATELMRSETHVRRMFTLKVRSAKRSTLKQESQLNTTMKKVFEAYGTTAAVISYSIKDPELVAAKALGLASPAAALWEGLPFSWLLDYAVKVGDFLDRMTATKGLSFVHGCVSQKWLGSCYVSKSQNTEYSDGTSLIDLSWSKTNFRLYRRWVLTTWPANTLEVNLPNINHNQLLTVSALVAALLKKK